MTFTKGDNVALVTKHTVVKDRMNTKEDKVFSGKVLAVRKSTVLVEFKSDTGKLVKGYFEHDKLTKLDSTPEKED